MGKMQNEDYRLQTRGKMREKTAGNTSALVEVRRNLFKKKDKVALGPRRPTRLELIPVSVA